MNEATTPGAAAPQSLARGDGATIAYHRIPGQGRNAAPGVVFLHGLMSDMTGGKALHVEAFCRAQGRAFVRFDSFGHGRSSGVFTDGTVGRWADDAVSVLDRLTEGPQVLVGSSLGAWIMLLAALRRPHRVAGLIGIAAAPDFTEDLMPNLLTPEQKAALERDGKVDLPSDYGDPPYTFTRRLLDEGRDHLVLRRPIALDVPARFIHGLKDKDVPWETSLRAVEAMQSDDAALILVKDGDHRLSEPRNLERLSRVLEALLAGIERRAQG